MIGTPASDLDACEIAVLVDFGEDCASIGEKAPAGQGVINVIGIPQHLYDAADVLKGQLEPPELPDQLEFHEIQKRQRLLTLDAGKLERNKGSR
jgi:hypothetical protein